MESMNQNEIQGATILVVDDEKQVRKMIRQLVIRQGHTCILAGDANEALECLAQHPIDLVITDISMPEMNGIELTGIIKQRYEVDVIMMTGFVKDLSYEAAISTGASDFIQKPFTQDEFYIRVKRVLRERYTQNELKESLKVVEDVMGGLIRSLSATVEARDPYTSGHQKRVSTLAVEIGRYLHLEDQQIRGIQMASVIHDLGKIAVPSEILAKPSRLSSIEFNLIKTHPEVGYDILKDVNFPLPIAEMIYQHHERLDGSGYPRGLKNDQILLESQIIGVADVVEAISSHRPYRPALSIEFAFEEITKGKGTAYIPEVVDACINVIQKGKLEKGWS